MFEDLSEYLKEIEELVSTIEEPTFKVEDQMDLLDREETTDEIQN